MFSMGYRSDSKRAQPTLEPGRVSFPTRARLRRAVVARDVSVDVDPCYAACERVVHPGLEGKNVQVQFIDQLERATIKERQAKGIALAGQGRYHH